MNTSNESNFSVLVKIVIDEDKVPKVLYKYRIPDDDEMTTCTTIVDFGYSFTSHTSWAKCFLMRSNNPLKASGYAPNTL